MNDYCSIIFDNICLGSLVGGFLGFFDERTFTAFNVAKRSDPEKFKDAYAFPGTFHLCMNLQESMIVRYDEFLLSDCLEYLELKASESAKILNGNEQFRNTREIWRTVWLATGFVLNEMVVEEITGLEVSVEDDYFSDVWSDLTEEDKLSGYKKIASHSESLKAMTQFFLNTGSNLILLDVAIKNVDFSLFLQLC